MKVSSSIIAATAALTVMGSIPAFAADFDGVRIRQQERIREGLRSGQLTRGEFVRLEEEQAHIDTMIRRARADGHVDRYERAEIERAQDVASRHIYREKHDGEARHHRWGWWRHS